MSFLIRLPQVDTLRSHEQLEAGMSELFVLLQREIELYRYSAGFPEYSSRIIQRLRRFCKETHSGRWRTFGRGCIDACERYSSIAVETRSKLQEAPKDVQRLECLRPGSEPSMRERHEIALQKEMKAMDAKLAATSATTDEPEVVAEGKASENAGGGESARKRSKSNPTCLNSKKQNTSSSKDGDEEEDAAAPSRRVMDLEDEVREGVDWSSSDET